MLKNLPEAAEKKLVEIFNNVLISGCVPEDWEIGEVVLALKKNPPTCIENYLPITLISCISKLMTKIIAKRISAAVESSQILGPEQQGFRKGRRCEDNIYLINSILTKAEQKKAVTHLLFLDLKEAYDRVDRMILYKKLSQLNFPASFIDFLKDYYSHDYITSSTAGSTTRKLYLTRGLRQGCNLSAILFIIYLSELGNRLRKANVGIPVYNNILLSFLKFADDLVMFSGLWSEIMILIKILEKWCQDFRMVISVSKTKVVTPDKNLLWRILNLESGKYEDVERLQDFKYLGILQKYGVNSTMVCNAANKLEKAKLYQRNILRMRRLIPDKIEVYLAMWNNVAIPSIIYGLEAIPFDKTQEDDLEAIQITLGRSILGVRHSTPSLVIYTELGLKPIGLLISERKIRYVQNVLEKDSQTSELVKLLMIQELAEKTSPFYKDLARRVEPINQKPETISSTSVALLKEHTIQEIIHKVNSLKSLAALPIPKAWWRKQEYLKDESWSLALTEFRVGNAKLGNRDDHLKDLAVSNHQDRIVTCPLCLKGPNNEIHLLVQCTAMVDVRKSLNVSEEISLQSWIDTNRQLGEQPVNIVRKFLGGQKNLPLQDYVTRGYILIELRDQFFSKIHMRLN